MIHIPSQKLINKAAGKLLLYFPDWITGNSEILHKKYRIKTGLKDCSHLVRQKKIQIMSAYMLICFVFIILISIYLLDRWLDNEQITSIKRPDYGKVTASVPMEAHIKYKDFEWNKDITLKVNGKGLIASEKKKVLQTFEKELRELILGENVDFDHISKPLNLIDRDMNTGINVLWLSDQPEIINKRGEIDLLRAERFQKIQLHAKLELDGVAMSESYLLRIDTNASLEDYKLSVNRRLMETMNLLREGKDSTYLNLPDALEEGIEIRWVAGRKNNAIVLFLIFLVSVLIVYFKRYDQINKELKEAEESISRDLPAFMNKLVLLLNAGLVVSTAFSKIVADYEAFHHGDVEGKRQKGKSYLYEELCEIQKRVNQSNTSLIGELKEFSQRTGVREMVRFTAVICDNWSKGSMLAEKLEEESGLLWISRKKRAEEKGNLAETKLTFPLMISLIVLIMVTIAPALMEM